MPYEMLKTAAGWAIVNADREVVTVNDRVLDGLDIEEADDMVDLLNRLEAETQANPHQ